MVLTFYKDLFAILCFIFFGAALAFHDARLYFGALMCGALSMTAKRKQWPDPFWAGEIYERSDHFFDSLRKRLNPDSSDMTKEDDDKIDPLPPVQK